MGSHVMNDLDIWIAYIFGIEDRPSSFWQYSLSKTVAHWIENNTMSAINNFKKLFFNNKEFKAEYLAKSPLDKWLFIRKINIFLLQLVGAQLMEADYKLNFKTLIPLYLMLNYLSLLTYTLFYYRHTPFRALQSIQCVESWFR